jgi:hypothetical protein
VTHTIYYDLKIDEEVAILPTITAPPCAVLEIAKIANADMVHLHLHDGRTFAIDSGIGLNTTGCIVRATHEHRKVLKMFGTDRTYSSCRESA